MARNSNGAAADAMRTADPPAILDVEASGFGRGSYPIEVGFVMPDFAAHCTLVRPEPHWTHWDPAAQAVHHIERPMLFDHGRAAAEVAQLLNDELHGLTVYCDGWAHDFVWLFTLFDAAGRVPSFRLEDLRKLLSEEEKQVWHMVKQQVANETPMQRHRASADARLLQLTLLRLRALGFSKGGLQTS